MGGTSGERPRLFSITVYEIRIKLILGTFLPGGLKNVFPFFRLLLFFFSHSTFLPLIRPLECLSWTCYLGPVYMDGGCPG